MDLIKEIHKHLYEQHDDGLSPRLENEAVEWMHDLIMNGDAADPEDAAHATLDDIAGFEDDSTREGQVMRLLALYHKKYGAK